VLDTSWKSPPLLELERNQLINRHQAPLLLSAFDLLELQRTGADEIRQPLLRLRLIELGGSSEIGLNRS